MILLVELMSIFIRCMETSTHFAQASVVASAFIPLTPKCGSNYYFLRNATPRLSRNANGPCGNNQCPRLWLFLTEHGMDLVCSRLSIQAGSLDGRM